MQIVYRRMETIESALRVNRNWLEKSGSKAFESDLEIQSRCNFELFAAVSQGSCLWSVVPAAAGTLQNSASEFSTPKLFKNFSTRNSFRLNSFCRGHHLGCSTDAIGYSICFPGFEIPRTLLQMIAHRSTDFSVQLFSDYRLLFNFIWFSIRRNLKMQPPTKTGSFEVTNFFKSQKIQTFHILS